MPSQKHSYRHKQTPRQGPEAKQSLAQIAAHSTALRQTPKEFLNSVESDGILEAATPEYESLSVASGTDNSVQDQSSWDQEKFGSRAENGDQFTSGELRDFIHESVAASETLAEYLNREFAVYLSGDERKAFELILSELDQRTGLLKASVEEITKESGIAPGVTASVLKNLKEVEPHGIGSSSKIEYQHHLLDRDNKQETAEFKILSTYLANPNTRSSDLTEVVEEDDLFASLERINHLPTHPWKGSPNSARGLQIPILDFPEDAQPEIRFVKERDEWVARVVRDQVAPATLAPAYREMIRKLKADVDDEKPVSRRKREETRNSERLIADLALLEGVVRARSKSRDNLQLLDRIEMTKQKVIAWQSGVVSYKRLADFVAKEQATFFETDCDWTQLKPLSRKQVADAIHVHPGRVWSQLRHCWIIVESATGRTHPPLPLLALITSSQADTGAPPSDFAVSAEREKEARALISRIIGAENPNHRVKDDILLPILTACGHTVTRQWIVSRRTRLGYADVRYGDDDPETPRGNGRAQPKEREWILLEVETLLKRLGISYDRAALSTGFREMQTKDGMAYNPFAANMVLRHIVRQEPQSRPLSAAHLSVLLRTLGFPLSRQWVTLALAARPDGRKKSEESFQWRPEPRPPGSNWEKDDLAQLLRRIGYQFDRAKFEDAYEKVIEREREISRGKMRQKRQRAKAAVG